jgi:hypothetical protein
MASLQTSAAFTLMKSRRPLDVCKVKTRVDGNFSNDFDQEFRRKGGEVVVVLRGRHGENVRCRSVDDVAVLSVQFRRKSSMTVTATAS